MLVMAWRSQSGTISGAEMYEIRFLCPKIPVWPCAVHRKIYASLVLLLHF